MLERCADFEIPEEFFSRPEAFLRLPYPRKLETLKSLYRTITPEMVLEELDRYVESERRYSAGRKKGMRERLLDEMIARFEAEQMLREELTK